ncbi:DUF1048 domain-containing protein [Mumia sp. DW29H23]|uniref:DUF1048 domain-containing protein n=1 Tax=Mumia sp. DW29H23 TaxID=3421241 RepID=UPI003D68B211
MIDLLSRLVGDKRDWKRMEARANALPEAYSAVYAQVKSSMWRSTAGDGTDIVAVLADVLALFEAGAAEGRHVSEVTGPELTAFCRARLPEDSIQRQATRRALDDVRARLDERGLTV